MKLKNLLLLMTIIPLLFSTCKVSSDEDSIDESNIGDEKVEPSEVSHSETPINPSKEENEEIIINRIINVSFYNTESREKTIK